MAASTFCREGGREGGRERREGGREVERRDRRKEGEEGRREGGNAQCRVLHNVLLHAAYTYLPLQFGSISLDL